MKGFIVSIPRLLNPIGASLGPGKRNRRSVGRGHFCYADAGAPRTVTDLRLREKIAEALAACNS